MGKQILNFILPVVAICYIYVIILNEGETPAQERVCTRDWYVCMYVRTIIIHIIHRYCLYILFIDIYCLYTYYTHTYIYLTLLYILYIDTVFVQLYITNFSFSNVCNRKVSMSIPAGKEVDQAVLLYCTNSLLFPPPLAFLFLQY